MKKRAQFPDARTYVVLMRGLAKHVDIDSAKSDALKIYHSMFHESARVSPSIMHTNAVLNVCANAKDMDAIWGIVSRLPEHGANSPDAYTYTTVLKGLRKDAMPENARSIFADRAENPNPAASEAIAQGKKIWLDIIRRWRRAEISIDENLMCAMGELLMTSSSKNDIDDVLSLVAQVGQVKRQASGRDIEEENRLAPPDGISDLPYETTPVPEEAEDEESSEIDPFSLKMAMPVPEEPKRGRPARKPKNLRFAQPGNHTLSLILKSCIALKRGRPGQKYWDLLTAAPQKRDNHKIQPDLDNYMCYFELLRAAHNSSLAVEVLRQMDHQFKKSGGHAARIPERIFRLALPAATRNVRSPNAMGEAVEMYKLMLQNLPFPDLKVMFHVVELTQVHPDKASAVEALRLVLTGSTIAKPDAWKVDKLRNEVIAVEERDTSESARDGVILLARSIISSIDRLFKTEQLLHSERKGLESARVAMSFLVERHKEIVRSVEPLHMWRRQRTGSSPPSGPLASITPRPRRELET